MQQAYQALRVISEAQTVRIVLGNQPCERGFSELINACAGLRVSKDNGIKAVILDFSAQTNEGRASKESALLTRAKEAVHALPQPALAVVRGSLSSAATCLAEETDFILIAHEASLDIVDQAGEEVRIAGRAALKLGRATWSVSAVELNRELERILDMLRNKSAAALRLAKASVRTAQSETTNTLEALRRVNQFYLEQIIPTRDAQEGLQAFLEKRPPRWQNH